MSAQRLYMAVHVEDPFDVPDAEDRYPSDYGLTAHVGREPAGWREYSIERWGTEPGEGERWPLGHKPFFWPKTDVPYKSRSAAQRRVDIINYWGGNAVVMECTPQWETVEVANARRERDRIERRINKKRAELDALIDMRDVSKAREWLARSHD